MLLCVNVGTYCTPWILDRCDTVHLVWFELHPCAEIAQPEHMHRIITTPSLQITWARFQS